MKINKIYRLLRISLYVLAGSLISCDPEIATIGENPYLGGREPLGIGLSNKAPLPEAAYPGDEVVFGAKGLMAWSNPESDRYDFEFYIADEKVEIKTATDSTITI